MRDLPAGFDQNYQCLGHPERPAVAPLALRLCEQCRQRALENYADPKQPTRAGVEHPTWADRGPMDLSIRGDYLGWYKPQKDFF